MGVIQVIRATAYFDSVGGWVDRPLTKADVAELSARCTPPPPKRKGRRRKCRVVCVPRKPENIKPGQPRWRWAINRFRPSAIALMVQWEREGRYRFTVNRADAALDVPTPTEAEADVATRWIGQHAIKPRMAEPCASVIRECTWYIGGMIRKEPRPADEQPEPTAQPVNRERGWSVCVYPEMRGRWAPAPVAHVEVRIRDRQFLVQYGIRCVADIVKVDPMRIIEDKLQFAEVDEAGLCRQIETRLKPATPTGPFARPRIAVMRRASSGMAQWIMDKWGRHPALDRRGWYKRIPWPAWLTAAAATADRGNTCHQPTTTRDIDVITGMNEVKHAHEEVTPPTHTAGRGSPSQSRRDGGDEEAGSESGVRSDVGGPSNPTTQHDVPQVLQGPCVAVERSRVVSHERSQEASTTRRRLRLPRWCFGERVRLFPCPPERRGWPAVPAAGAWGTVGTPGARPRPTRAPRPPRPRLELSTDPPPPEPGPRLHPAAGCS